MSDPLWRADEAAAAANAALQGAAHWIAEGVSIDTRSLAPGDLFVALKDVRDGHEFVQNAFAKGAAAALVSDASAAHGGPALVVDDVLEGLRGLGRAARDRSEAKRIAVTGSVGKTSTKEALAHCLAPSGATHASVKSYNNHWGVPLTLARMPAASAFGVFEMGMNHRGEILPLTELVRPDVAIVTWIAPAHVENLGSLEAVADEKGDVFAGLTRGGAALAPNEAPMSERLIAAARAHGANLVRFGRDAACEARLLSFAMDDEGASAQADILGKRVAYRIGAPGAHWALNSVAALAAVSLVGADVEKAAAAFAHLAPIEGRGAQRSISAAFGVFTLIDDSYNANPASMAAAIATLGARAAAGRKIAALGDMLELGPDERAYHAQIAEPIEAAGVDLVFAAGPRMAALYEKLPASRQGGYADTAAALAPKVIAALGPGDVVLVKGSNGSRMMNVVEALARLAANGDA